MRKNGLAVITALILGLGASGCSLFIQSNKTSAEDVKSASCKGFQDITIFNAKKSEYYIYDKEKRSGSVKIRQKALNNLGVNVVDYDSGKMESTRYTERKDGLPEVFYCDKIEFLSTISSENKSFGINGNGANDSNANVIKEVYNTQKVKDGKVTAKNIKVTTYRLEPIKVVKYNGVIYTAGSPTYQKIKNLRDKLTCLTIKNRTYCDGDLVKNSANDSFTFILKAYKNADTIEARLFRYSDGMAWNESSEHNYLLKDEATSVVGNHNLKEYNMSDIYTLKLGEVKTFKEW